LRPWILSAPTTSIEVKADRRYLSDMRNLMGRMRPYEGTLEFLRKHFPQFLETLTPEENSFRERGTYHYVSASTHGGDEYFIQRVCLLTLSDLTLGAIRFRFSDIETKLSPKS
jgi:hypothetical protein